jgi:hypothetical protein
VCQLNYEIMVAQIQKEDFLRPQLWKRMHFKQSNFGEPAAKQCRDNFTVKGSSSR